MATSRQQISPLTGGAAGEQNICLVIKSMLPHMSRTQRAIGEFIIRHPAEASLWNLDKISKHCGISPASLSRFVKQLGFPNCKAFQITLALDNSKHRQETEVDPEFGEHSPEATIHGVYKHTRQSLADSLAILDKRTLMDLANAVCKADHVMLYGMGGSSAMAKVGEIRLNHLGINARAYMDSYEIIVSASNLTSKDVVIAISHSGQAKVIIENVKLAMEKMAYVVALTNYANSPLALVCKNKLLTVSQPMTIHAGKSSSRVSQVFILECLYFMIAQAKAGEIESKVTQLEGMLEKSIH